MNLRLVAIASLLAGIALGIAIGVIATYWRFFRQILLEA